MDIQGLTNFGTKQGYELLRTQGGLTSCRLECRDDAEKVADGLKRLIIAPPEEQRRWRWDTPEDIPRSIPEERRQELIEVMFHQGQCDLGLMRRENEVNKETGEPQDPKWLFHYKVQLHEVLAASGANMEEYGELLHAADRLLTKGRALWDLAMDTFEILHPNSAMVLRCALYDPPSAPSKVGAQCHWDRNDGTIHFADSKAGLLVPKKEDYQVNEPQMTVLGRASDDLVYLFVSAKLAYLDPQRFNPVWHGGMNADVGESRWAIIGFYHLNEHSYLPPEFRGKTRDPVCKWIREASRVPVSSR
ncbi:MAG: 2OG-Fe(II) oxygenase family protein [Patescibacteria group bacterium]